MGEMSRKNIEKFPPTTQMFVNTGAALILLYNLRTHNYNGYNYTTNW